MLDTQYNDKVHHSIVNEIQSLSRRLSGLQKLLGLKFTSNFSKLDTQDVGYKDSFRAEISLKIDKYSGAVDIGWVHVMTKFSV